jgi:hypothetical protein
VSATKSLEIWVKSNPSSFSQHICMAYSLPSFWLLINVTFLKYFPYRSIYKTWICLSTWLPIPLNLTNAFPQHLLTSVLYQMQAALTLMEEQDCKNDLQTVSPGGYLQIHLGKWLSCVFKIFCQNIINTYNVGYKCLGIWKNNSKTFLQYTIIWYMRNIEIKTIYFSLKSYWQ